VSKKWITLVFVTRLVQIKLLCGIWISQQIWSYVETAIRKLLCVLECENFNNNITCYSCGITRSNYRGKFYSNLPTDFWICHDCNYNIYLNYGSILPCSNALLNVISSCSIILTCRILSLQHLSRDLSKLFSYDFCSLVGNVKGRREFIWLVKWEKPELKAQVFISLLDFLVLTLISS
jgi:hypothetical protein